MALPDEATEYQRNLKLARITLTSVLSTAEIDASTWSRWRRGKVSPRLDNWRAFTSAAESALAAKSASGADQSGSGSQDRAA